MPSGTMIEAAAGGVVASDDGSLTIKIPPGALADNTAITVDALDEEEWPDELSPDLVAGAVFALGPDGLTFSQPVEVSLKVPPGDSEPDTLSVPVSVLALRSSDGEWEGVETTILADTSELLVTGSIEHFSVVTAVFPVEDWGDMTGRAFPAEGASSVSATLSPVLVERQVGESFIATLTVDSDLESLGWAPNRFLFGYSGPLSNDVFFEYSGPSTWNDVQVMVNQEKSGVVTAQSRYRCDYVGDATFSAEFTGEFYLPDPFQTMAPPLGIVNVNGSLEGVASCQEGDGLIDEGIYALTSNVTNDRCVHRPFLNDLPDLVEIVMDSDGTVLYLPPIAIPGSAETLFFDPFRVDLDNGFGLSPGSPGFDLDAATELVPQYLYVPVEQTNDGLSATGFGPVAGFSGIEVTGEFLFDEPGHFTGTVSKGTDGRLPGGCPIEYEVEGTFIAPHPGGFLEDLSAAFREPDPLALFEDIHPDFAWLPTALYGPDQCYETALDLYSPDLGIVTRSISGFGPWELTIDGVPLVIDDTFTLEVTRYEGGESTNAALHVGAVDGNNKWFLDCGDPLE